MRKPRSSPIRARIREIRRSLRTLDRSLSRLSQALSKVARSQPLTVSRGRRRLSAKARASLKLQGRYLGLMRHLKPRRKAEVRRIREAKGVRAAIRRARRLVRGSPR